MTMMFFSDHPWGEAATNLPTLFALGLFILWVLTYVVAAFGTELRKLPGPFFAKFTRLYLFIQAAKGNAHTLYVDLHIRYGSIVRVAPDKVSLANPDHIPLIYGIGNKFNKVNSRIEFVF